MFGLCTTASALTTEHPALCKTWDIAQGASLTYGVNGVFNTSNPRHFIWVYCPVIRISEVPAGGNFGAWVDGITTDVGSTCTLTSKTYSGALLGSVSVNLPIGVFDQQLILPAAQVPMYSYQELDCMLDDEGTGLYDIEPVW